MTQKKVKLSLSKEKWFIFILLCLGSLTISFNVAAITAAIPVISVEFGVADFIGSKIIPTYLLPYGLGALIYAPLATRLSYKRLLGLSMTGFALASAVCGMAGTLNELRGALVFAGLSAAAMIPLGLMMLGEFFEKAVRGRLVGLFFASSFGASLAGILTSGIAHWRWLFFIPATLGTLTCLLVFGSNLPSLNRSHGEEVSYLRIFRVSAMRHIFIFIFIVSALYHGVHKWFGVYLSRIYQMDNFAISMFFVVAALGGFCGHLIGGHMSDNQERSFSCFIGLLGLSLTTMLLAGHYSPVILGLIFFLISLAWTIGHNGISTVLADAPDRDRPAMASLNSSVRFISGGIGFNLSGLFVKNGFETAFLGIGVLMLIAALSVRKIIGQA